MMTVLWIFPFLSLFSITSANWSMFSIFEKSSEFPICWFLLLLFCVSEYFTEMSFSSVSKFIDWKFSSLKAVLSTFSLSSSTSKSVNCSIFSVFQRTCFFGFMSSCFPSEIFSMMSPDFSPPPSVSSLPPCFWWLSPFLIILWGCFLLLLKVPSMTNFLFWIPRVFSEIEMSS